MESQHTEPVLALFRQAEQLIEADPDRARDELVVAIKEAQRIELDSAQGYASEIFGRIALRTGHEEMAEQSFVLAQTQYQRDGDTLGAARAGALCGYLAGPRSFADHHEALAAELSLVERLVEEFRRGPLQRPHPELYAARVTLELRRGGVPGPGAQALPSTAALQRALKLTAEEMALLMAAAAPALDERLSRSMRAAQGDLSARTPGAWFLAELLRPSLLTPLPLSLLDETRTLRRSELIALHQNPDRPRSRAHLLVELDGEIAIFLEGDRRLSAAIAGSASLIEPPEAYIGPPQEILVHWRHLQTALQGSIERVMITGSSGAGKKALGAHVAHTLGRRLLCLGSLAGITEPQKLEMLAKLAARDALLHNAYLALDLRDGLSDSKETAATLCEGLNRALRGHPQPVFLIARHSDAAAPLLGEKALEIRMPPLSFDDQVKHFSRALNRLGAAVPDATLLRTAGCQAGLTAGLIEEAITRAVAAARLRNPQNPRPSGDDIREAVRLQFTSTLSGIAQHIVTSFSWEDLILPHEVTRRLMDIAGYVKYRSYVFDQWGFGTKVPYGRGVSALFAGPSGTGKTMAATIIAADLGLDLYRIDLSQVVSKWIGETEKNLSRIFDRASDGQAILLFDEADALFAKRTDVKGSVDRYSNMEVNYLLQRLESFDGIVILTTNYLKNIDEAFRRRLRFIIEFPMPTPAERADLWRSMIPAKAQIRGELPIDLLSDFDMPGGNIKNAIMRAAFAAAARHDAILPYDLLHAAALEMEAMGRLTSDLVDLYSGLELPPDA